MYPSLAVLVAAFTKRGAGRKGLGRGTREQGAWGREVLGSREVIPVVVGDVRRRKEGLERCPEAPSGV